MDATLHLLAVTYHHLGLFVISENLDQALLLGAGDFFYP